MASVNKVIIVGNLGRDPEVRYMPSGDAIANMAVATSYRTKDRNTGEQKEYTEWHRITMFGRDAEIAQQYLKKGSSVYVEGRLQTRKYTDKDGIEKYATDIIAERFQMLGTPERGGPGFNDQSTPMNENTGRQQQGQGHRQPSEREQNRNRQYGQGNGRPPVPNFSDMDDDIPF